MTIVYQEGCARVLGAPEDAASVLTSPAPLPPQAVSPEGRQRGWQRGRRPPTPEALNELTGRILEAGRGLAAEGHKVTFRAAAQRAGINATGPRSMRLRGLLGEDPAWQELVGLGGVNPRNAASRQSLLKAPARDANAP